MEGNKADYGGGEKHVGVRDVQVLSLGIYISTSTSQIDLIIIFNYNNMTTLHFLIIISQPPYSLSFKLKMNSNLFGVVSNLLITSYGC